ncbi:transglycosylase domain-containing protein [Christensenellaceae bacterium OttesenSCG-928-M15]|nr:transglycosylase domain-containing protein [Christensenellaceae bacterium OttesenSCG-928-M15]
MEKIKSFFRSIALFFINLWRRITGKPLLKKKGGSEQRLFPENGRGREAGYADEGDTRLFAPIDAEEEKQRERAEHEPLFVDKVRRRPFVLSVLFTTIRFLIVGVVLMGFAGLGAAIGVAKAYVDTAPVIDKSELTKSDRTSYIYDKDNNLITTFANVEYRDWVDIEEIPLILQQAFISIEDVRFYEHSGVDFKRLFSAALEIFGNRTASGGSTITQQLIKNKILDNERTYKRKIQEAFLALELEAEPDVEKEDILEAYLNDIHLGESNYGVKTAAKDYFNKELDELTVRECAMLAGLTQNPYFYNPRKNKYTRAESYWQETTNRTNSVLGKMYEAGYITKEEYRLALKEDVYIVKENTQGKMYDMPYFVEYAIYDVVSHLLTKRGLEDTNDNRNMIEKELRTGGYHIYTTVDTQMQHLVQDALSTWDDYPRLQDPSKSVTRETKNDGSYIETPQPQASAVVLDYHTGELRAIIGGRDTPEIRKGLNRAYMSSMEVGSSIKPLAVYGPALDRGASPATIIANFETPIDGWGGEKGYPYIGSKNHIGPTTIRRGIVSSLNVVAGRTLFEWVTPQVGGQYLRELGATVVNEDGPGLALGTSSFTPISMAAAYGAIANGGEYKEPLSFTRVIDGEGNVVLDANEVRYSKQVYKKSTAYMLVDMLTDAVNSGTGTKAKIKGMTVAGKTGTNDSYKSVYFAGMTPYYSASLWVGHDTPSNALIKSSTGGTFAAPLWQKFMSQIHEGLPDKAIIDESPVSLGLVKKAVCSVSGLLATEACDLDQAGHKSVTDWMLEENAPTTYCNMHIAEHICNVSGQIATEYCPSTSVTSGSVVLIAADSYYADIPDEVLLTGISNYVRTPYTYEEYAMSGVTGNQCTLHTADYQENPTYSRNTLQWQAADLRDEIIDYLNSKNLPTEDHNELLEHARTLNGLVRSNDDQELRVAISAAEQAFAWARNTYGR